MRQSFILMCFVALLMGAGCTKKPANSNQPENTNEAVASQFADITDANVALAEGNRLLDENQTRDAIEAFRQAVKLNPDLAEAYFKMGIAYSLVEMEAVQTGATPDPSETNSNKEGRVKLNSEKAFDKAVVAYKKWVEANPNDDVAFFNLGRTYYKLNNVEEAEKMLAKAVKLKPNDTEYQTEWGGMLIKLAKYHEAIPALKKAIELDASNTHAEELLDEADAGAKRLDYVSNKKDSNRPISNSNANANANIDSNSNANTGTKLPDGNSRPRTIDNREKKPPPPTNKPH